VVTEGQRLVDELMRSEHFRSTLRLVKIASG
jgi:hypothetical protein